MSLVNTSTCVKCLSTARETCGRCKRVAYCSKECQTQDWKQHKKACIQGSYVEIPLNAVRWIQDTKNQLALFIYWISGTAKVCDAHTFVMLCRIDPFNERNPTCGLTTWDNYVTGFKPEFRLKEREETKIRPRFNCVPVCFTYGTFETFTLLSLSQETKQIILSRLS